MPFKVMLTQVHTVPQPEHAAKGYCPRVPGVRMPATYINHYAANGGAVVPQFGGWAAETDALAIKTLQAKPHFTPRSFPATVGI